jgi:hypothetical protein
MTTTTKNPHAVSNVNVAQGPRTGNRGTPAKRGDFQEAKAARAPLATTINKAYGERAQDDYISPKGTGISPDTKAKFKK